MTTSAKAEEKTNRISLPKLLGVVVAAIPILGYLGYLTAYMRELAFSQVFGFPSELMSISWVSVLPVVGVVVGYLAVAIVSFFAATWLRPHLSTPRFKCERELVSFVLAAGTLVVLCIWIHYSLPSYWSPLWSALWDRSGVFIWIAAVFVMLIFFEMHWSFLAPIDASDTEKSSQRAAERMLFGSAWTRGQKITMALATIAIVLILLVWFPWYTGELQAKAQRHFWVASTYPESVVLRIYGDRLICGGLDGTKLDGSFFVVRLDDEPRPVLTLTEMNSLQAPRD